MRRFLPVVCSAFLISYGCAGGESTTAPFGGDDGGGAGDDAGIITGDSSIGGDSATTADAATDSGPLKTCMHNDDCTAPNLCSGTSGQACMGGFCVPTGKAENCDDGVACTNDSCDANANKCVHTPNDAACPNGSYCDGTMNCVQTLPCTTAGDTVCDRLDTTSCDGLWSCDTVAKHCVHGAKPCADRANATTMCTPMGQNAVCAFTCAMGYVDSNMDLNAMGTSNGCECHATDPIDKPTLANVDGNCDGIVGNIASAIFVAKTGSDANPGTMALPKLTIQAGIAAAAAATPVKDVYVSTGNYGESIVMADGVSVYGGYDATTAWSRALTNVTLIAGQTNVAVGMHSLTKATELQLVSVTSPAASGTLMNGDGMSSYGVVVTSCSGGVTIRGCTITAGNGAPGSNGLGGAVGAAGGGGGSTSSAAPGAQGSSSCGAPGGVGGTGIGGVNGGVQGGPGGTAPNGGVGGAGGAGGPAGNCSATSSGDGQGAPAVTSVPGNGGAGTNAAQAGIFGSVDAQGIYNTAFGLDGMTSGYPGGGGGGGGSGGGSAHASGFPCTNCNNAVTSGGGGGGGGGGCGGTPGHAGRGGGGSFAIVTVASVLTVDATKMNTAVGGAGGAGGNGGTGGGGGGPGNPAGGGNDNNFCSSRSAGGGSHGGSGGTGGQGGGGSGGTGGPSICVLYKGTSPTSTNTTCTRSAPGVGGGGGSNGVSAAPSGQAGQFVDSYNSP